MFNQSSATAAFILVGPYEGKTIHLHGFSFVKGRCSVQVTPMNYQSVVNSMDRNCQAYLEGSDTLKKKQKWYKEVCLGGDQGGKHNVQTNSDGNPTTQVPGNVQQDGSGAAEVSPEIKPGDGAATDGNAGVRTDGDGFENSGHGNKSSAIDIEIKEAILTLDIKNDDHWTKAGLPDVSVIRDLTGDSLIKREDIEAVLPGYTRQAASS